MARGGQPRSEAALRMAAAIGCSDCASIPAASASSVPSSPSIARMAVTAALPVVSVPVLSKANARTSASVSSAAPPLNRTPPRAAADRPDRMAAGTEMTTAQGLAATSTVAAR